VNGIRSVFLDYRVQAPLPAKPSVEILLVTSHGVKTGHLPYAPAPTLSICTSLMNYQAMFKILEADIVVMQETKIQRKDLQDDMVLVPGWDVFFSLPKHKKGIVYKE